ncbi:hypothetical protein SF2457T_0862 [Shigella flexneri 2a str. 2457T]|nr:hypothetical protein SF2457T_0862 [Shigella flexneri 2a str. 2457T]
MRQSLKMKIPRIKNLLNGAASDAERSSARMQRFYGASDSGGPADNAGGFFGCNSSISPCADGGEECTGS